MVLSFIMPEREFFDTPSDDETDSLFPPVDTIETPELGAARVGVIDVLKNNSDNEHRQDAWGEYDLVSERIVTNQKEPAERVRTQIALLIHKAIIFYEVDDIAHYIEELKIARLLAHNEGFDDIVFTIDHEISITNPDETN